MPSHTQLIFYGLSTSPKPSGVHLNDLYFETDTGEKYFYSVLNEWINIKTQDYIIKGEYDILNSSIYLYNNSGWTYTISGITGGGGGIFTGGTVTGPTTFLTGVTFNSYINFNGISYTYAYSGTCAVGTATTISINTTTIPHRSIHIKYVLDDGGTNMRAGNFVMISNAANSGTNVEYSDTSTNDIGSTSLISIIGVNNGSGTNQIKVINGSLSSINIYFEYTLI